LIAFGTKDGKVGIFDYMSNTKYYLKLLELI
jgi:hypothetical protein